MMFGGIKLLAAAEQVNLQISAFAGALHPECQPLHPPDIGPFSFLEGHPVPPGPEPFGALATQLQRGIAAVRYGGLPPKADSPFFVALVQPAPLAACSPSQTTKQFVAAFPPRHSSLPSPTPRKLESKT